MSDSAGKFVWCEWMGADLGAAADFYHHVIGWEIVDSGMAGFPYKIASVSSHGVAGMLTIPPEAKGAPPCWTAYIWADDVDAGVEKLKAAGGRVLREAMDIPNVGRFAIVTDNQGAPFALFHAQGGQTPPPPPPHTAGLVGWRELHAADGEAALAFYQAQFGWRHDRDFDMGPMGVYRIFDTGAQQGGMMTKMAQGPGPCWHHYFNVAAADSAAARVAAKGGKVVHGPQEVPGGQWTLNCVDPEGALFGLVAPKR